MIHNSFLGTIMLLKISKKIIDEKVKNLGTSFRALRDFGLSRNAYENLTKESKPKIRIEELCLLGKLLHEEPLSLLDDGDNDNEQTMSRIRNANEVPSDNKHRSGRKQYLLVPSNVDDIKREILDSHENLVFEAAARHDQDKGSWNERKLAELEMFRENKQFLEPSRSWINLLEESKFLEVSKQLETFDTGLDNLIKVQIRANKNHERSLQSIKNHAQRVVSLEQLDDRFTYNDAFMIYHLRADLPLKFSEVGFVMDSIKESHIPAEEYRYEYEPMVTHHCFVVAPKIPIAKIALETECMILNTVTHMHKYRSFQIDFRELPLIDEEIYKKYMVKIPEGKEDDE